MIKIFRNIRKQLLNKRKMKSYSLYAIGEIILVVIGILIALQINNWNENKKNDQSIKLHLENLKHNLTEDHRQLEIIRVSHSFKYHALQYLIKQAGEIPYDPSRDEHSIPSMKDNFIWNKEIPKNFDKEFVNLAFLWSHRVSGYQYNASTYNELKSTATLSQLESQGLKIGLNNYYALWDARLRIVMRDLTEDWQKSLESDGVITSNLAHLDDPISLIKNNNIRIAKLKRLIRECAWWVQSAEILTNASNQLIDMIDKEIEKL